MIPDERNVHEVLLYEISNLAEDIENIYGDTLIIRLIHILKNLSEHFAEEKMLMEFNGYPDIHAHLLDHVLLLDRVFDITKYVLFNSKKLNKRYLKDFLKIIYHSKRAHIQSFDYNLFLFLLENERWAGPYGKASSLQDEINWFDSSAQHQMFINSDLKN